MKKVFGLCILVILFLVATGCTQPAPTAPATTTVPATTVVPVETTAILTAMPTENATQVITVVETATMVVANVTAPATEATILSTPSPVPTPLVTAIVIHIRNNTFVPAATTVLPGTGIIWINDDTINHAVKATGVNAGKFNSGDISPGSQWSYTFGASEGTFGFADAKFPQVNGTIIVKTGKTLGDLNPVAVVTHT
jgi:plastocyanin